MIRTFLRAQVGDVVERLDEVLRIVELLPDEPFGFPLVRRDEERLRLRSEPERLSLRVEHRPDPAPRELADRLRIETIVHTAGQRAGEDDHVRAAREVAKLLEQELELLRRHVWAPLIDLRVCAAGGVDHGGGCPRLLADSDEIVEDPLARELADDPRARPAARQPGRHDRDVHPLQRAGDVHALATGEREAGARAVALAGLKVWDRHRPVEGRVHGHCHDQENQPPM